jgi:hypothetical protein
MYTHGNYSDMYASLPSKQQNTSFLPERIKNVVDQIERSFKFNASFRLQEPGQTCYWTEVDIFIQRFCKREIKPLKLHNCGLPQHQIVDGYHTA